MRVRISAHSPLPDIPYLWCAGRHFPTKGHREVEVLEQEDDPPTVFNDIKNPVTGAPQKLEVPNQDVMGMRSYTMIVEDGRFTVIETGRVDAEISGAQVAAARAEVSKLAAEKSDLAVRLAALEAQLASVKTAHAAEIASLKAAHEAEIEQATDPAQAAPVKTAKGGKSQEKAAAGA